MVRQFIIKRLLALLSALILLPAIAPAQQILLDDPNHAQTGLVSGLEHGDQLGVGTIGNDHTGDEARSGGLKFKQWAADINTMFGQIFAMLPMLQSNGADDTTALTALFASGVKYLPAGTFFGCNVPVPSGTYVQGGASQGYASDTYLSTASRTKLVSTLTCTGPILNPNGSSSVYLGNIFFDCVNQATAAIGGGAKRITLDVNTYNRCPVSAVGDSVNATRGSKIFFNEFANNATALTHLIDFEMTGGNISNNTGCGVQFNSGDGFGKFFGVRFEWNNTGLCLVGSSSVEVVGNDFDRNSVASIMLNGANMTVVAGNNFRRSGANNDSAYLGNSHIVTQGCTTNLTVTGNTFQVLHINDGDPGGVVQATAAGNVLTVVSITSGSLFPFSGIQGDVLSSTHITDSPHIIAQLTQVGSPGGVGTYQLSASETISSAEAVTATAVVAPKYVITNNSACIPDSVIFSNNIATGYTVGFSNGPNPTNYIQRGNLGVADIIPAGSIHVPVWWQSTTVAAGLTDYTAPSSTATSPVPEIVPMSGTFHNLYFRTAIAPSAGTNFVATLMTGTFSMMVATALACVIASGQVNCTDTSTDSVTVGAGQGWTVQVVNTSTGATGQLEVSMEFDTP
jgi:hypothetical protein